MRALLLLLPLTALTLIAQSPGPSTGAGTGPGKEFWNTVFAKETMKFRREASAFVQQVVEGRPAGRALDLGMGQGRNALFLASQGWQVTGVDISNVAIAEAQATAKRMTLPLTAIEQSLDDFDLGQGQWDLIVLSYMQFWLARQGEPQHARLVNALADGGLLAIEGFAAEDAPGGPAMGFQTNQLLKAFGGRLKVMEYRDSSEASDWKLGTRNRVMRLVAQRVKP